MKKYRDIETGEVITENDLSYMLHVFAYDFPEDYKDMSLDEFISSMLWQSGGSLEVIK